MPKSKPEGNDVRDLLNIDDRLRLKQLGTLMEVSGDRHFLILLGVDTSRLRDAMLQYVENFDPGRIKQYSAPNPFDLRQLARYYTENITAPDFLIADLFDEDGGQYDRIAKNLLYYRSLLPRHRLRVVFVLSSELLRIVMNTGYEFHSFSAFTHYFYDFLADTEEQRRGIGTKHPALKKYAARRKELQHYENQPNNSQITLQRMMFDTARLALDIGKYREAEDLYHRILNLIEKKPSENRATALGNIGIILSDRGDLEEALKHHREALEIFRELGNRQEIATQIDHIGYILQQRGDLEEALKHHREALEIFRELGNRQEIATQIGYIGYILQQRGGLEEALKHCREALEIHRELGNRRGLATQIGHIGYILQQRGGLEEALKHCREALEIHRELGNRRGLATQIGYIGYILQQRGDLEEALKHYRKALEIFRELGDIRGMAAQIGYIGIILRRSGNLDEALKHHRESLSLSQELGDKIAIAKMQAIINETLAKREK